MIIGGFNLLLFFFGILFLIPKKIWKTSWFDYKQIFLYHYVYLFIIIAVVAVHLLEVKIIDQNITNIIGRNFTLNFQIIEDGVVYWFSQNWTPLFLYFFVFIYIGVIPTILNGIEAWMTEHEYASIQQMKGSMSQGAVAEPAAFERANYMKELNSFNLHFRYIPTRQIASTC